MHYKPQSLVQFAHVTAHTAKCVLLVEILSVHLVSVTRWYCTQTNEDRTMPSLLWFSDTNNGWGATSPST